MKARADQIKEVQAAIAAQEAARGKLGNDVVELSLKPLRGILESLLADEAAEQSAAPPDELMARLQSYIPKQLADKIRATGHVQGERRHVTVVFADVSGFTSLSETLDPEDVAAAINDCLKELADAVYQYEGMVDSFIGDCVMAVFGAPIAQEDDAERALRAALSMRERLEPFNRRWIDKLKEPLGLHIGVNSGTVIAGSVGNDFRMRYAVMGDTVNVASRLQGVAQRGQIFVSQNTYRLTRGAFTFRALEPVRVKGKKELVTIYELVDARVQPEKLRGLDDMTSPFVGREPECELIDAAFESAEHGAGRVILLHGEAGIGKSRLLKEIRANIAADKMWLEGRCFASSQTISYGPFLDFLRRHLGIADEQNAQDQQIGLRRYVAANFSGQPDVYPVLAQLLAFALSDEDALQITGLLGERYRSRLFAIIEQLIVQLASANSLAFVVEDTHWADESSVELIAHLIPLVQRLRLTIFLVTREANEPALLWNRLKPVLEQYPERCTEIVLRALSADASRTLISEVLSGDQLPAPLVNAILAKSEGNPFFVEEVLRSLIEQGLLVRSDGHWTAVADADVERIPDTLQAVLLSRLDRLPEESKRIVQKAAVIGRIFFHRVLERIAVAEGALNPQIISTLQAADLIRQWCDAPEIEYIFKHALTQEIAYQTLLTPARRALHKMVGDAIATLFHDRIDEFSAVLAYHYFQAHAWEDALEYSRRAGNAAYRVYAHPEARGHYRRALDSLEKTGQTDTALLIAKVDLVLRLVATSVNAAAPETNLALLADAEKIAQQLGDTLRLAWVHLWIGRVHYAGGNLPEAIHYFQKVVAEAPAGADPELIALPGAVLARVLFAQGHFKKCLEMIDQAMPLFEATNNQHEMLMNFLYRGGARACLGDFAAALPDLERVLAMTRAARDQNGETFAYIGLALIHFVAGKYEVGVENARKLLALAERIGDTMLCFAGYSFLGWGMTRLGRIPESLSYWKSARAAERQLGGHILLREWFGALEAEALLVNGDADAALRRGREALALAVASQSEIGQALAQVAIGLALAGTNGPIETAHTHVSKGREMFERLGARYDVARAFLAEGKVLARAGDRPRAIVTFERAAALCQACGLTAEEADARNSLAALNHTSK